ncbi:MAG: phosphoglycerate dehydrogenase [Candidatus Eremiobacter antarcticus]|nr:phosphoglycerate dehydrogenase [Candidatus Eremiobacteraeota bacterium]MBC5807836.1 phosphoglycerate dehydrogenase [Candidatus Eremiobacteraeota bacterium]
MTKASARSRPIVVVAEPLAASGLAVLETGGAEIRQAAGVPAGDLPAALRDASALIVRSKTKVNASLLDAAPLLKVIGRAGVGVDAIDVDAATRHGIVVINTPDSSTLAASEHTFAMLLALCRHLCEADRRVKEGSWRAHGLAGVELSGKTLGVVGLGRIGAAVAARARAFGMDVIAHDAVVGEARAQSLGVTLVSMEDLLKASDFVTLHAPLTPQTRGMIARPQFAAMKRTARIVNCARGGLIAEDDLLHALEAGEIAGAALDVVSEEPPAPESALWKLLRHPRVVATPHLGGSTEEAQERIAIELCRDVIAVLRGRPPSGAVNAPLNAPPEVRNFVELAHILGRALPQLSGRERLAQLSLVLEGSLGNYDGRVFVVAFLVGLLPHLTDRRVSAVNAEEVARELGIAVSALAADCERGFAAAIAVRAEKTVLAGTVIYGEQLRLVELNGFDIDVQPQGNLLFTKHRDVPGVVGKVGTALGLARINISNMQVARDRRRQAIMLLGIDRPPANSLLRRLQTIPGVSEVKALQL